MSLVGNGKEDGQFWVMENQTEKTKEHTMATCDMFALQGVDELLTTYLGFQGTINGGHQVPLVFSTGQHIFSQRNPCPLIEHMDRLTVADMWFGVQALWNQFS